MIILKKIDNFLTNIINKFGKLIKKWWQTILLKRQQSYVTELRDNIVVTKRGLAHLQRVHEEQNRRLIKMQSKLV